MVAAAHAHATPAKPASKPPAAAGPPNPAKTTSPRSKQTPKERASGKEGTKAPSKGDAHGSPGGGLSAHEKARLAAVDQRAAENKSAQGTHQTPKAATDEAHAAVLQPQKEADGKALAPHTLELEENAPPDPDIVEKVKKIKKAIRDRRPVDENDLGTADPKDMAKAAGAEVSGDVQGAAQGVKTGYAPVNDKPTGTADKDATPIPATAPAPGAPAIDATQAAPDGVNPAAVSLANQKKQIGAKAKQAELDRPEVKDIKDGPVAGARDAQADFDQLAIWGPDEVVKTGKELRAHATADFRSAEAEALKKMQEARKQKLADVASDKDDTKTDEEKKREAFGKELDELYDAAADQVRAKIAPLADTALKMWDDGIKPLSDNFDHALGRVDAYIKEHRSSTLNRIGDFFLGLPGWIVDEYETAEQKFADGAGDLALTISSWVNGIIRECQKLISDTRKEIQKRIAAQGPELQAYALEKQKELEKQFGTLEKEVTTAKADLSKQLAKRLVSSVKEKDEKIEALREQSKGLWQRFEEFVGEFIDDPVRAIVNGLLRIVGIPPASFWALVEKFSAVVDDIADKPKVFANNLVAALKLGFQQFKDNIETHLLKGLLDWLTSKLKDAGVQTPRDFSLKSLLTLFLQILGISWPKIRAKLVKYIGEKNMRRIELAWEFLKAFIDAGWDGVWKLIQEKLDPQQIVDAVINAVKNFLIETIVKKAAEYVISLFNPAGIIYQALKLIYEAVVWIIDNAAKIFTLIESIVNGAADILAGAIGGAAKLVENALGAIVPIVIDLFAKLLGLGGLPDKVKEVVGGLQEAVDAALDKVIDWVAGKIGLSKDEDKRGGDVGERLTFSVEGEEHSIWIEVEGDNATVMMASDVLPMEKWFSWLEREKMKGVDAQKAAEGKQLISTGRGLLQKTDSEADKTTVAMKKSDPSGATDAQAQNDEVKKDEHSLMDVVRKLVEIFALKAAVGHPMVGTYAALRAKSETGYQVHHVPPKALANWIAQEIATIGKAAPDLINMQEMAPVRAIANAAAAEHNAAGNNLSSIVLHENTHIRKTGEEAADDYRVHHGKKTSELVEQQLKKMGIKPIRKGGEPLDDPDADAEDIKQQLETEKEAQGEKDPVPVGHASTQFYLRELRAAREQVQVQQLKDVDAFLGSIRNVFYRAWVQALSAVQVGLDNSKDGKDGDEASKNSAVGVLTTEAPATWGPLDPENKVTHF